jgi:signal peptidase II
MKRSTRYIVAALIILACLASDRGTKNAAVALRGFPPSHYLGGTVTLLYAENAGAMLSVGAGLPGSVRFLLLTVGVGILIAGLLAYLIAGRDLPPSVVAAMALMVGGGGSNLFDRIMNQGRVVDFLVLGAGGVHTGVFNMADIAITCGVVLFFFSVLAKKKTSRGETA